MRLLATLFHQSRKTLILALIAGVIAGAGSTSLLVLLNSVVVRRTMAAEGSFFAGFFAICLLVPASALLALYLLERLGQGTILKLRMRFSRQILSTPLRHLEELGVHRLLTILTDDIAVISQSIVNLPGVTINAALVAGCLGYLAWLSPLFFLLLLGLIAAGVLTYQIPASAGLKRIMRARRVQETLVGHFRGLLEGVKELKLHNPRRRAFLGLLKETAQEQRRLRVSADLIFGSAAIWGQLLLFLVIGGLLLARNWLSGDFEQALASYMIVLIFMVTPLQAILETLPRLGAANAAVMRIEQLGLSLKGPQEVEAEVPQPSQQGKQVRLEGIRHSYRNGQERHSFSIGPIDLTLRPGELTFLIGGNGSGKTTLAKIVTGLYVPDEGRVLLEGAPVGDENREAFRQNFSVLFSDFFLFDRLLGLSDDGSDGRSRFYLQKLQLESKVEIRAGQLSTTSLSQGQRKRLALLTAYLEDRPVYLFDEWAADQDPVFKQIFYRSLLPELKERGKTVLVISHDDHYYSAADRIIKLDYGQIEYDGPAAEFSYRAV